MATDSPGEEFVTIVPVGESQPPARDPAFVTVLTLGATAGAAEVAVRRPRGARLGLGLKFEGGSAAAEKVRRLLVQSCTEGSPAANACTPWGKLIPGDEILAIDGVSVSELTRIDCVRHLKDSDETLTLLVRHFENGKESNSFDSTDSGVNTKQYTEMVRPTALPPPVPPRKLGKKNSFKDKPLLTTLGEQNGMNINDFQKQVAEKDTFNNGLSGINNKLSRKSSFDSHLHRQNKESITCLKRGSPEEVRRLVRRLSDGKTMPPDAEVYIDLLSTEWERCLALADAESDDTGSSISTVVDRLSSMASSVENSIPSTPIMQPKTIDIQKVLNCIENIDSDILKDIATSKIVNKQTADNAMKASMNAIEKCFKDNNANIETALSPLITEEIVPNPKTFMKSDQNNNSTTKKVTCINGDVNESVNNNPECYSDSLEEKPKPMPRNTKAERVTENKSKSLAVPEMPPPAVSEPLLTPTKKNCIENWLQRSEAEMTNKSCEQEVIPEALPRLIDFVPKPQFKESDTPTPLARPTTAPPPPPPAEAREDGSGASLDTIGELDEPNDIADTLKHEVPEKDTLESKAAFESCCWEERINRSDTDDKSLSNDETPLPTCPRQPPDGVETPNDVVEKIGESVTSVRPPPRLPAGWPSSRSRLSYSRPQDARSEASVKDKIAMFSNDRTPSSDNLEKFGTLPTRVSSVSKNNPPYTGYYTDVSSLDRRLTKSQDNLDDVPRVQKIKIDRPEVLGALKDSEILDDCKISRSLANENKPMFYGSTTTLPSCKEPLFTQPIYHNRSISDDNGKNVHKSNLEYLIEQRKKSMSKLRGLVIPEVQGPVVNLPEIKIQDSLSKLFLNSSPKQTTEKRPQKHTEIKPSILCDTKWKTSVMANNIPKYSPAFKRKSLQVYSPTSLSKESTPERKPYSSDINYNSIVKSIPSKPPRTSLDTRNMTEYSTYNGIASKFSIKNNFISNGKDIKNVNKCFNNIEIKICTATDIVDSDNDSAMSSTQSSYRSSASSPLNTLDSIESDNSRVSPKVTHFTSYSLVKAEIPTKSLATEKNCEEYVKRSVCRSVSSDTNVSLSSSAGSAATSGSQASCSSLESSVPDSDKRKVVKTYNIDTINRRNILASAKCRSGRDAKLNSPVIETKFSHENHEISPSPQLKSSDRLSSLTSSVSANANKGENRRRNKVIAETDSDSDNEVNVRQRKNESKNSRLKRNSSSSYKNKQNDLITNQPKIEDAPKAISERIIKEIKKAGLDNYDAIKNKQVIEKSSSEITKKDVNAKIDDNITKPILTKSKVRGDVGVNGSQAIPVKSEKQTNGAKCAIVTNGKTNSIATADSKIISQVIRLKRGAASGVGLILAGGTDCEAKDVTVHRVLADSVAEKAGLKRGAKVRSINGRTMSGLTHAQSVAILKEQRAEIVIEVDYDSSETPRITKSNSNIGESKIRDDKEETISDSQSDNVVTVVLEKAGGGAGLGFGLDGGRDSPYGDRPLTIKKLFAGGAAARSGRILVGAELLSAGGQSMEGYTRTQAWAALKALPSGHIPLVLRNPKTTVDP